MPNAGPPISLRALAAADAAAYNDFFRSGVLAHPDTLRISPADIAARPFTTVHGSEGTTFVAQSEAGSWLGVVTVEGHEWVLVPTNLVLGAAYGLCLVAGLIEVQRLASPAELARATSVYYALTYLGFAAPYLLTRAHAWASYPTLLTLVAGLALATAATIAVENARHPSTP